MTTLRNLLPLWTFAEAEARFSRRKRNDRVKLANNTYLRYLHEPFRPYYGVQLHNTVIIFIDENDNISLETGGYRTVTTKDRINRLTPHWLRVFSRDYEWRVQITDKDGEVYEYPFCEGFTVNSHSRKVQWFDRNAGDVIHAKSIRV